MPSFDMDVVWEQIMNELFGPGYQGGCRSMWHTLRLKNIQGPRRVVAELMGKWIQKDVSRERQKALKEDVTSRLGRTTHGMSMGTTN